MEKHYFFNRLTTVLLKHFLILSYLHVYMECKLMLALISLRFSVNRRIFVVGFGLYGSIHGPTDYQVNIQVRILINNNILTALKDETAGLQTENGRICNQ